MTLSPVKLLSFLGYFWLFLSTSGSQDDQCYSLNLLVVLMLCLAGVVRQLARGKGWGVHSSKSVWDNEHLWTSWWRRQPLLWAQSWVSCRLWQSDGHWISFCKLWTIHCNIICRQRSSFSNMLMSLHCSTDRPRRRHNTPMCTGPFQFKCSALNMFSIYCVSYCLHLWLLLNFPMG